MQLPCGWNDGDVLECGGAPPLSKCVASSAPTGYNRSLLTNHLGIRDSGAGAAWGEALATE